MLYSFAHNEMFEEIVQPKGTFRHYLCLLETQNGVTQQSLTLGYIIFLSEEVNRCQFFFSFSRKVTFLLENPSCTRQRSQLLQWSQLVWDSVENERYTFLFWETVPFNFFLSLIVAVAQELLQVCQVWEEPGIHDPDREGRRDLLQR